MHAAVDLGVGALGLVPRSGPAVRRGGVAGQRVGQRTPVRPWPSRHRLDHHHAYVTLGAGGEQLFGGLAILGPRPQCGVDGEHHCVEVEAAQRLEVHPRDFEVVPGDAGEPGMAGVAELEDPLQRRRAPVELLERRHGVRLVEVEDLGVEEPPGRVELLRDAVGIGPQGLGGDEQLATVRREMRPHHGLGRAVLGRDVEVVHTVVEGQLQEGPRLLHRGRPSGSAAEHSDAAVVIGPPEAPTLHPRDRQLLRRKTLRTAPRLSATTAKRPGSMSAGPMSTEPPSSCTLATLASVSATAK